MKTNTFRILKKEINGQPWFKIERLYVSFLFKRHTWLTEGLHDGKYPRFSSQQMAKDEIEKILRKEAEEKTEWEVIEINEK